MWCGLEMTWWLCDVSLHSQTTCLCSVGLNWHDDCVMYPCIVRLLVHEVWAWGQGPYGHGWLRPTEVLWSVQLMWSSQGLCSFFKAHSVMDKKKSRMVPLSCMSVCLSVRLSVCPSVRLSHLFDYVPIIVSSWNFQELSHWTRVRSMQKVKVRGQRSRSQRSRPKFSFPDCNSSLNSHMMMKWYI